MPFDAPTIEPDVEGVSKDLRDMRMEQNKQTLKKELTTSNGVLGGAEAVVVKV